MSANRLKGLSDYTSRHLIAGFLGVPHAAALALEGEDLREHFDPEIRAAVAAVESAKKAAIALLARKYELEGRVMKCPTCGSSGLIGRHECEESLDLGDGFVVWKGCLNGTTSIILTTTISGDVSGTYTNGK